MRVAPIVLCVAAAHSRPHPLAPPNLALHEGPAGADSTSTWASGAPALPEPPQSRSDLVDRLYHKSDNPLRNVTLASSCPAFPWSITEAQLQLLVDPVLQARAAAAPPGQPAAGMLVLVEVGVMWGDTSVALAERVHGAFGATRPELLASSAVISVDTWLGDLAMWGGAPPCT